MSEVKIEHIKSIPRCELGEAPHWDHDSGSFLFVDAFVGYVRRYYPATDRLQCLKIEPSATGTSVTFVLPVEGEPELFVVSVGREVGLIRWRTSDPDQHTTSLCSLATVELDKPKNNFNDGKCDHKGQVWAGTKGHESEPGVIDKEQGNLYIFSSKLKPKLQVDKINLSNGLAWSADKKRFYYIDTVALSVDSFDYDAVTDGIANRRKLVDYTAEGFKDNYPDGMTVDKAGNLWVANFNGAKLLCINGREGGILRTLDMPIQSPTSVCWGGPHFDQLYVTTSSFGMSQQELDKTPESGGIFRITGLGASGSRPYKAKLDQTIIDKMK